MPRLKKLGEKIAVGAARGLAGKDGTDFSITDAAKRLKGHKKQLQQVVESSETNEIDDLNNELESMNEPESIRRIFAS
jgi:hypothetical protein